MSLLSVKTYIVNQASNIQTAGTIWKTIHPYRQRVKREKAGFAALLAVGDVTRDEGSERSMPRGLGEKVNVYQIPLLLYCIHSDEVVGGDHFDALVENTCDWYRRVTPGNPVLVDAINNQTSYLTHIGERIRVRMLTPEFAGGEQSRVFFRSIITLEVREILSPA
jgi:hypothetical protein